MDTYFTCQIDLFKSSNFQFVRYLHGYAIYNIYNILKFLGDLMESSCQFDSVRIGHALYRPFLIKHEYLRVKFYSPSCFYFTLQTSRVHHHLLKSNHTLMTTLSDPSISERQRIAPFSNLIVKGFCNRINKIV